MSVNSGMSTKIKHLLIYFVMLLCTNNTAKENTQIIVRSQKFEDMCLKGDRVMRTKLLLMHWLCYNHSKCPCSGLPYLNLFSSPSRTNNSIEYFNITNYYVQQFLIQIINRPKISLFWISSSIFKIHSPISPVTISSNSKFKL